ncbi:hypothetical protein SAMN04488109_1150 [Chryseolinea serpens]|uniref:Uncharacterized protein n=1 Tax=Chryseolinea serpens TaxID=947013 RepID=A0A1M5LDG7_9BACT|nr:hypothetical protein SAMN04488109_1150 [Chryseolinea serpens]
MKRYRKLTRTGIYIFIAIGVTAVALIFSGWYLRLKGDVYGREYNESRMKQGQPIIEDYFVRKPKRNEHLTVWFDSTESHVHTDKSYFTTTTADYRTKRTITNQLLTANGCESSWVQQRPSNWSHGLSTGLIILANPNRPMRSAFV